MPWYFSSTDIFWLVLSPAAALKGKSGGGDPSHTVDSSSIDAENATLGDGANHVHQLCFAGSAATRACRRTSKAADGSIVGSSSSNTFTARNSFTRTRHAAHVTRCFSISRRSPSFRRPSTYPKILLSIRLQLMTSFPSWPNLYRLACCAAHFYSQGFSPALLPLLPPSPNPPYFSSHPFIPPHHNALP